MRVGAHLKYLAAKDKVTVTGKYVSHSDIVTGLTEKDDEGNVYSVIFCNITYEYTLNGKTELYVRKDRSTWTRDDIELVFYRNSSSEPYKEAEVCGMWAAVKWLLLVFAVYIGGKAVLSGIRGLKPKKAKQP